MKTVSNLYGTITKQYLKEDGVGYTVLYSVEHKGMTFKYTSCVEGRTAARLLMKGIHQWYLDTALVCKPYSIEAMKYAFYFFKETDNETGNETRKKHQT